MKVWDLHCDTLSELRRAEKQLPGSGYDFLTGRGRSHGVRATVEYGHIELVFQFLDERRQCRLRHAARLRRACKMAVSVHRHYIFHLLKCHDCICSVLSM